MNKPSVIIIGNGSHARMIQELIEEDGNYTIIGVTSNDEAATDFYGYPVLGTDNILETYFQKGVKYAAMGIGGFKNNNLRRKVFNYAISIGYQFINLIHSSAVVSKYAKLGQGIVINPNVIVNNEVVLGDNCMLACGSIVSHETILENHVLISAGVVVGGNCTIGEGTLCALGSKIVSGVNIGKNVLVAAGAVVVSNIEDNAKVFGVPAKKKIGTQ